MGVEGPCGNWYNQTFLESLNRPEQTQRARPAPVSSIRTRPAVGSANSRRRPANPQSTRQNFVPQPIEEEPLPPALAALAGFGQQSPAGRGSTSTNFGDGFANNFQPDPIQNSRRPLPPTSFDRPQRPTQSFEASSTGSSRGRVRQRQRGTVPQRTSVRQELTVEDEETFARPPPPRRRPDNFQVSDQSESGFQSFGSRQRQRGSQLASEQSVRGSLGNRADLLSQVEAEIARREQLQQAPLSRGSQFPRGRRRQEEEDQVIESARPALQRFDEDEEEFARFQPQRQRNRG